VQNQTVEVGSTAAYYYVGKDAALAFGTAVPFGLNARQMESAWRWQRFAAGGIRELQLLRHPNG
jgi:TRAP-type mannitol/chloroaromatic compound transport system substrate-binding protein